LAAESKIRIERLSHSGGGEARPADRHREHWRCRGTTGSTRAMRANPDGYTIEMGQTGTHAIAVTLYPNLAYKRDIDFAPIGLVSVNPVMIVARKDIPPRDFKEFVPM